MHISKKICFAALFLLVSISTHAATLPPVTGLEIDESVLSWDAQEGASGYNLYRNYRYYDTVKTGESYELVEPGTYLVIAFNDNGDFGATGGVDEDGNPVVLTVVYNGDATNNVNYTWNFATLIVTNTCSDVGPGETCTARCPDSYETAFGGIHYFAYMSGGACSTSDIVEADALVSKTAYSCTVPTYSGAVVAQAICIPY